MALDVIINVIFKLTIAFCFGATNALIIALASSKGNEAGYLDSLLGNVKKAIFFVGIIAFGLSIYLTNTYNITPILITIILINTIIFGIYFGAKWKIPTSSQTLTLMISGLVSLVIWYIIIILIFK